MAGLTTQELLALIMQGGAGVAGGVAQARSNSQQTQQNAQTNAQSQQNFALQQQMAALQNAQQTGQNLQTNRQNMPQTQASMSKLGDEQTFLQRQRLMAAMLPEMAKFNVGGPTDPAVAAAYRPPTNMLKGLANPALQASYGDQATATSLADRRKLMAQINPDYQFSSLGNFGLDPRFDHDVNQASIDSGARLKAYEAAQSSLANQQTQLANQQAAQAQQAASQPQQKKGGGIGGAIGGLLKTAAPFAALIPGVGPLASMGIGAAGAALGDKMQGNSMGHALGAGVLGGAMTGVGEGLQSLKGGQGFNPFNNGSGPALNNAMTSASLPATFMGGGQSPQLNLPSSNLGGFSQFAGGVSQNAPNLGGGGTPRPAAPRGPAQGPPAPMNMPTSGPMGPTQIGANPAGRVPMPSAGPTGNAGVNAAIEQIRNNPMFSGYSTGGFGMGGGALTAVMGAGQKALPNGTYNMGPASTPAPNGPPQTNWPDPKQLGPGPLRGNPVSPSSGQTFNMGDGSVPPARLNSGFNPKGLLGSGPQQGALPPGQYDMGVAAGAGPGQAQIPRLSPSTVKEIQALLSKMPDGAAKMQQMRKLLMGQ